MSCIFKTFLFALFLQPWLSGECYCQESRLLRIEPTEEKIVVSIANGQGDEKGEVFFEYRLAGFDKPIVYPLFAAEHVSATRHYPMQTNVDGEEKDHPHHKSAWFAHGDVNGIDFWSEKGIICHREVTEVGDQQFSVINDWYARDVVRSDEVGEKICEEATTVSFDCLPNFRWLDFDITIRASEGPLTFGDTKEGTFAIRTCPGLRLVDRDGKETGAAFNSEGIEGKSIWGQAARWVYYSGTTLEHHKETTLGIAMMDHPQNFRHPTTWHAREYGLIAANPFGLGYFDRNLKKGTGDFSLPQGDALRLRYRILITNGHWDRAAIEREFDRFSAAR